jgi:hypothetical protein
VLDSAHLPEVASYKEIGLTLPRLIPKACSIEYSTITPLFKMKLQAKDFHYNVLIIQTWVWDKSVSKTLKSESNFCFGKPILVIGWFEKKSKVSMFACQVFTLTDRVSKIIIDLRIQVFKTLRILCKVLPVSRYSVLGLNLDSGSRSSPTKNRRSRIRHSILIQSSKSTCRLM